MKNLKKVAKKAITQLVDPLEPNPYGWPPACTFVMYEPERPMLEKSGEEKSTINRILAGAEE